jgi:hypothetical protein
MHICSLVSHGAVSGRMVGNSELIAKVRYARIPLALANNMKGE